MNKTWTQLKNGNNITPMILKGIGANISCLTKKAENSK